MASYDGRKEESVWKGDAARQFILSGNVYVPRTFHEPPRIARIYLKLAMPQRQLNISPIQEDNILN